MDFDSCDSKAQVKAVAQELKASNSKQLYTAVSILSTSLVMGFEAYVRMFDSATAVTVLTAVLDAYVGSAEKGDLVAMTLRAVSLVLEHVPSSYESAQEYHPQLIKLASLAIHKALCDEWVYQVGDPNMMIEEGLRVVRFVAKDDRTGHVLQFTMVGDLLTLCTNEHQIVERQALETLYMLCSKVVMPSEFQKASNSVTAGILSLFRGKKKEARSSAKNSGSSEVVAHSEHPIVIQVENVIAPLLITLIEDFAASLASIPEQWAQLELSLQCLYSLMERSLLCHRLHTARSLASPLLPKILFSLINMTEETVTLEPSVRSDRVLLCETILSTLTNCNRTMMLESLLLPEANHFFRNLLGETRDEITTLLQEPFPRVMIAARSTQRRDKDRITAIAAIQLFVLACPAVPPNAFGLRPKLVLPVHQWMWEDEVRHSNRLLEEQCVSLETSWARLDVRSSISVHLKHLEVDLTSMTMSKGARGGHRNISRNPVPFVYHFADEVSLRPIVAAKEAGPYNAEQAASQTKEMKGLSSTPSSATRRKMQKPLLPRSSSVVMNTQISVPTSHFAVAESYFNLLCSYAKNTSGQMAKQVATCACASVLQLMFLSDSEERVTRLMSATILPMCEMFREALISADKATKAVVLTMVSWMLHRPVGEPCNFIETALRCGLLDQLDMLSKTTYLVQDRPTRTATLAEKAGDLVEEIIAKLKASSTTVKNISVLSPSDRGSKAAGAAVGGTFLTPIVVRVRNLLSDLRSRSTKSGGTEEALVRELLRIFEETAGITVYEVFNIDVPSTVLYYLLGGRTLEHLVGHSVMYSAGASACTSSPGSVPKPDAKAAPIDRAASTWEAMLSSGVEVRDVLLSHVAEDRVACLMTCAMAYPTGFRHLISSLVSTLSLQSQLPLVESVVTYDKVICRTPLQAHEALCDVAPLVMLCGEAGRRIDSSSRLLQPESASALTTNEEANSSSTSTAANQGNGHSANGQTTPTRMTADTKTSGQRGPGASSGTKTSHRCGAAALSRSAPSEALQRLAKEYCMQGHRLRRGTDYAEVRICDRCNKIVQSGLYCRTCRFDVCVSCHTRYCGNVELIGSLAAASRNRAHLCATAGDVERWFRTGTTSTKGTQTAPTSQSALNNLERFTTRALVFLRRYSLAQEGNVGQSFNSSATLEDAQAALAQKLLARPQIVRHLMYGYLTRCSTRGELSNEGTPLSSDDLAKMEVEVELALSEEERGRAATWMEEIAEDRYLLYRASCGQLPYQETFLATLYRRAFAIGDQEVLLQLENCLLRPDGGTEDQLSLQSNGTITIKQQLDLEGKLSPNISVLSTKKGRTPLSATAGKSSFATTATERIPSVIMTSIEKSTQSREFEHHRVNKDQTYLFHHFESDEAVYCSCNTHSRTELNTEEPPVLTFTTPEFAHRNDMLLLILLHSLLCERVDTQQSYIADAKAIFTHHPGLFTSSTITTAIVKSLEASALRVSLLPPRYALPRWVNFVLKEARFLLPTNVREHVARFLAYGARRAFIQHMRAFRNQRNDHGIFILPGEWAVHSNHKYTVDRSAFLRDAFTILRKSSELRLPISIEFKGDVGVGQGPTAQFYTLLATEVSSSHLDLWRGTIRNAALPPSNLPPRRSAVTPLTSPPRNSTPRGPSTSNRASSSFRIGDRMRRNPSSLGALSPTPSMEVDSPMLHPPPPQSSSSVLLPPAEGYFPRATVKQGNAHVNRTSSMSSPRRKDTSGNSIEVHVNPTEWVPNSCPKRPKQLNSVAVGQRSRRSVLVNSNVGLIGDFVLSQQERAKAFYVIGAAMGRAFLDEQVLPLQLSPALIFFLRRGLPPFHLILSDKELFDIPPEFPIDTFELPITLAKWVDKSVAHSLASLASMDAASLEALELPFTMPGDDSFELLPGGANIMVTASNLRQYAHRVIGALVYESVAMPLHFLTMGCRDVIPREALGVMETRELMSALCGDQSNPSSPLWTTAEIRSILVGDHGYQNDSPQLELLAQVLGNRFTPAEQRLFLLFCTGCPRLPVGGIRAFGAITVVKRSNAFTVAARIVPSIAESSHDVVQLDLDGEEEGKGLTGSGEVTAASDADGPISLPTNPPHRIASSIGYSTAEDASATAAFLSQLPESEWALPSVNTCFHYLKLPPYPTEELMYRKLLLSITQCGDTFELS